MADPLSREASRLLPWAGIAHRQRSKWPCFSTSPSRGFISGDRGVLSMPCGVFSRVSPGFLPQVLVQHRRQPRAGAFDL